MRRLFNDNWEFSKNREPFHPVGLPHDWAIGDPASFYEDAVGRYRKNFRWEKHADERVFLRFDGVYMDSSYELNGKKVWEWKYGFSAFEFEITDALQDGENELLVTVDYKNPNNRWYSGAGIYRNVWLVVTHAQYLAADGIYFHAEPAGDGGWMTEVSAEADLSTGTDLSAGENLSAGKDLCAGTAGNAGTDPVGGAEMEVSFALTEEKSGRIVFTGTAAEGESDPETGRTVFRYRQMVSGVSCWDVTDPALYTLSVSLLRDRREIQTEEQQVGFRRIEFLPDQGFLLNGRKVELKGVCLHHDLGCLGSAFHPQAFTRQLRLMKEMGANAVRFAHNMPAAEAMEIADRMGMLVVSEAFDMWTSSKNTYDYARFFPNWYQKDAASWVRRDRNHPSLIMWSIGNEIYETHAGPEGVAWTKRLADEVRRHDPLCNAHLTIASNYMAWENAQNCADVVKLAGYNYGAPYFDAHHEAHPDWILYESEACAIVQSRGIYRFPYEKSVLADEDGQCSSLGNSTTSWGAASHEACIEEEKSHPYSCGQFLWSGIDYLGEPTPYHTKNSYFGQADTAGFPKDSYYFYRSAWREDGGREALHLFPYWDYNDGQKIDVRVYANAPSAELFLNGESRGLRRKEEGFLWQLPYEKGELRACIYDEDGRVLADEVRSSFGEAAKIVLTAEQTADAWPPRANGDDLVFVRISMEDADGHPVENADARVQVRVSGAGALVGTDNGDSTDQESYKSGSRRLFSGKLLAVAKTGTKPGDLTFTVTSPGLPEAKLVLPVTEGSVQEGSSPLAYLASSYETAEAPAGREEAEAGFTKAPAGRDQEIPVRAIRLARDGSGVLTKEHPDDTVRAHLCPPDADDRSLSFSVVDDGGIPSPLARLETEGNRTKVHALSDGSFKLRCTSKSGTQEVRVISELGFCVRGLGKAFLDPYGFIAGGLYDYSNGRATNGNEHGVATARGEETVVGFHGIDFGWEGSDEITIPVFALTSDPYQIRIYEGMPQEPNAELIADVVYQKPSVWNCYQEETYRLKKRLTGVTAISFVLEDKVHIKGFSFARQARAYTRQTAGTSSYIYGDCFTRDGEWIRGIGNNVTLEFGGMEFGQEGADRITIAGSTPLAKNSIILLIDGERQVLDFSGDLTEQTFAIEPVTGKRTVSFLFLPGCQFDFHWFVFERSRQKRNG